VVPIAKSKVYSRSFEGYAPDLWNSLPADIRDSVKHGISVDAFKRGLRTVLFSKAFRDVA